MIILIDNAVAVVRYIIYLHIFRYPVVITFSLRHYCPPVPLRTPLPHCPTASLANCPTASLCQCLMIPLACHPTVLLPHCLTVAPAALSRCLTAFVHGPTDSVSSCHTTKLSSSLAINLAHFFHVSLSARIQLLPTESYWCRMNCILRPSKHNVRIDGKRLKCFKLHCLEKCRLSLLSEAHEEVSLLSVSTSKIPRRSLALFAISPGGVPLSTEDIYKQQLLFHSPRARPNYFVTKLHCMPRFISRRQVQTPMVAAATSAAPSPSCASEDCMKVFRCIQSQGLLHICTVLLHG
jgi:hypothetical protein